MFAIRESLDALTTKIETLVRAGIKEGKYTPQLQAHFSRKLKGDLKYTEKGVEYPGAEGTYSDEVDWFAACRLANKEISATQEYSKALLELKGEFPADTSIDGELERFVAIASNQAFSSGTVARSKLIECFLDDLFGRPVNYGCSAFVLGMALEPEAIQPSMEVNLRRTQREDLERKIPIYFPAHNRFAPTPPLVIEINLLTRNAGDVQRKLSQCITILRLFKVASVKYDSYKMYTDSVIDPMGHGTVTAGQSEIAMETGFVRSAEADRLRKFWSTIEARIPPELSEFRDNKNVTPVGLAHGYYVDALMTNGTLEKRIAAAVMGLDALLSKDNQALSYKLSNRVARILSVLDCGGPKYIRDVTRDAYEIRSKFAHGDYLDSSRRRKLSDKYQGDLKNLFLQVMNFLRQLIVIQLVLNTKKNSLIALIDDSLVDPDDGKKLDADIVPLKHLFV